MKRLVVLVSGNGSNLQAILEACREGRLKAEVALVVSNRPGAYALERARAAGVEALVLSRDGRSRREYDAALAELVAAARPDRVVLAGFLHILSSVFLERFPDQVLNLHPALPGAFPGLNAIERAFEAGLDQTGVMVHRVDEGVDTGPVLGVEQVSIHPEDSLESLTERIHQAEHRLLIRCLQEELSDETSPAVRLG
ncbi:phosphoribosylglycinamide formyltransferase [bacterium CPR1]|nr:phosphoribosylglycinamide formyltransferase [bacterium CPR1]